VIAWRRGFWTDRKGNVVTRQGQKLEVRSGFSQSRLSDRILIDVYEKVMPSGNKRKLPGDTDVERAQTEPRLVRAEVTA
jgi:hypothetical protein